MPTLSTLILLAQWGLWACQTIMALQSDRQNAASPAPSGGPFAFLSQHQNQLVAGPPSASADSCVNAHPPPQRTAHRERGDTGKFKSQPWKQYVKVREGPGRALPRTSAPPPFITLGTTSDIGSVRVTQGPDFFHLPVTPLWP